ncbi:MAG: sulfotransferase [Actinomycetota bacterium]
MTGQPLFIIGCPRSGTTLLLDLLAGTRAFGYVTTSGARRDVDESLHARTRIYDAPFGEHLYARRAQILGASARLGPVHRVARRLLPSAIEPWEFWEDLIPTFRPEFGTGDPIDPPAGGLDAATIDRTRAVVDDLLARQQRSVLLSKYTDFPRVDLMRAIFPRARFVHIRRDAHAVANSYAVEIESGRFGTWAYRDWWSRGWSPDARDHWQASGATVLGFAAHNRNALVTMIDAATAADPNVHTVTYERLAADPVATLTGILDFAEVGSRSDLDRLCASRRVANTNDRWRDRRTPEEARLLDEILLDAPAAVEAP